MDNLSVQLSAAGVRVIPSEQVREHIEKAKPIDKHVDEILSKIVTAQTVMATDYPAPRFAVNGLIPQGTTFVAGPPKLGKSIFCLGLAVAVAEGGKALSSFDVDCGAVLYLALEDGPRRVQERLYKMTSGEISENLEIATEWPRLNDGGLEAIDEWINRHGDKARLIIVDTLKMLRPLRRGRETNVYDEDYDAIAPLTRIASQRAALLIVHHTRKMMADDPLATVSGSYGLTGAADGVLVLSRSRNRSDATLSVMGRDLPEAELALKFDGDLCTWRAIGKVEEVRRSDERQAVITTLQQAGGFLKPAEIAGILEKPGNTIRKLLFNMTSANEVKNYGGKYQLPGFEPLPPSVTALPQPKTTGNASETPKSKKPKGLRKQRYRVTGVTDIPQNANSQHSQIPVTPVTPVTDANNQPIFSDLEMGEGVTAQNTVGNAVTPSPAQQRVTI